MVDVVAIVADLKASHDRLAVEVELLRERLAYLDDPEAHKDFAFVAKYRLTRQEMQLLRRLMASYPRPVSIESLDLALPPLDHARDRGLSHITVMICKLRKRLPRSSISTVKSFGYALTASFYAEQS
jgi:DNA-binding response OmpR family regulator